MNILHFSRFITEYLAHTPHIGGVFAIIAFVIAFIETFAFFGYFLPGMVMIYTLGTIAARHDLVPTFMIATALGGFCADIASYYFGAQGGTFFQKQMKRYESSIKKTQKLFQKYRAVTIIIGKMIGIFRPLIAFIAGGMEMNIKTFVIASAVASALWATTYTALAFYVQRHLVQIIHFATNFGGLIIFMVLAYIIMRQNNRPSSHPDLSHLQEKK